MLLALHNHACADMIRFFKQHDLHTIMVPDVRAAAAGQLTSAVGAQRGIKQSTNEVRWRLPVLWFVVLRRSMPAIPTASPGTPKPLPACLPARLPTAPAVPAVPAVPACCACRC